MLRLAAHEIDMLMTKKSNLEVVLAEKWACLVSPASHFSRFSRTQEHALFNEFSRINAKRETSGDRLLPKCAGRDFTSPFPTPSPATPLLKICCSGCPAPQKINGGLRKWFGPSRKFEYMMLSFMASALRFWIPRTWESKQVMKLKRRADTPLPLPPQSSPLIRSCPEPFYC